MDQCEQAAREESRLRSHFYSGFRLNDARTQSWSSINDNQRKVLLRLRLRVSDDGPVPDGLFRLDSVVT
jgi:hypothetical protein